MVINAKLWSFEFYFSFSGTMSECEAHNFSSSDETRKKTQKTISAECNGKCKISIVLQNFITIMCLISM